MLGCVRAVIAVTLAVSVIAGSACGGDSGDKAGVIEPQDPDRTTASETGRQSIQAVEIRSRHDQYVLSRRVCRTLGPARIAYENDEAGTLTEIARLWAEWVAVKPAWTRAAFDGCRAGFTTTSRDTVGLPREERDFVACLRDAGIEVRVPAEVRRMAQDRDGVLLSFYTFDKRDPPTEQEIADARECAKRR